MAGAGVSPRSCSASLARASTLSTRSPSRPSVRGARAGAHAIEEMQAFCRSGSAGSSAIGTAAAFDGTGMLSLHSI